MRGAICGGQLSPQWQVGFSTQAARRANIESALAVERRRCAVAGTRNREMPLPPWRAHHLLSPLFAHQHIAHAETATNRQHDPVQHPETITANDADV